MRRFQINFSCETAFQRSLPARHANAPFVARFQTGEVVFRSWRDEIISIERGEIEKVLIDTNANRVQSNIFRASPAKTIAIKSRERIPAAALQFGSKNI